MIHSRLSKVTIVFAGLLFAAAAAGFIPSLYAEDNQSGSSASGFAIGKPRVFFGGHLGFYMPRAESDVFDMITRELTLNKSDFRAFTFGGDLGFPIASNFAVVVSFEYSRTTKNSESRDYVESNGDPIAQTTRLSLAPLTATFRYYPRKLGESVGSYAWMPTRFNPYIGGGVGLLHYNLSQYGRFVDTNTLNIFNANLKSSGYTDTEHIVGGLDVSLTPRIFVNGEARYSWADATMSNDFTGFQPIDLAGFRLLGGIYFRF